jgi:hypothetical protein
MDNNEKAKDKYHMFDRYHSNPECNLISIIFSSKMMSLYLPNQGVLLMRCEIFESNQCPLIFNIRIQFYHSHFSLKFLELIRIFQKTFNFFLMLTIKQNSIKLPEF